MTSYSLTTIRDMVKPIAQNCTVPKDEVEGHSAVSISPRSFGFNCDLKKKNQ